MKEALRNAVDRAIAYSGVAAICLTSGYACKGAENGCKNSNTIVSDVLGVDVYLDVDNEVNKMQRWVQAQSLPIIDKVVRPVDVHSEYHSPSSIREYTATSISNIMILLGGAAALVIGTRRKKSKDDQ